MSISTAHFFTNRFTNRFTNPGIENFLSQIREICAIKFSIASISIPFHKLMLIVIEFWPVYDAYNLAFRFSETRGKVLAGSLLYVWCSRCANLQRPDLLR
jgi:hypothetical protein